VSNEENVKTSTIYRTRKNNEENLNNGKKMWVKLMVKKRLWENQSVKRRVPEQERKRRTITIKKMWKTWFANLIVKRQDVRFFKRRISNILHLY
jgi:hypothetical protein